MSHFASNERSFHIFNSSKQPFRHHSFVRGCTRFLLGRSLQVSTTSVSSSSLERSPGLNWCKYEDVELLCEACHLSLCVTIGCLLDHYRPSTPPTAFSEGSSRPTSPFSLHPKTRTPTFASRRTYTSRADCCKCRPRLKSRLAVARLGYLG
jgi:hypothetical protein